MPTLTAMHWGVYEAELRDGEAVALRPFASDPAPSPIGLHALSPALERMRIRRPAIRQGWLAHRHGGGRGEEPFVEVPWDEALDLAAGALHEVKARHGNRAIFGGSYGWASAGRFHHAQSQIHRFLNCIGGYVKSVDSYSLGAAHVVMPHVVAPMHELMEIHTAWEVLERDCRLFVSFGGAPAKNAQTSQGSTTEHRLPGGLARMAAAGVRFVNISPVGDDIATGGAVEWLPIRPNTDTAVMLALAYVLRAEGLHDRDFLASHCTGFERFLPYLAGATDGQPKDPTWAEAISGLPAARIAALAREMAATRTLLNIAWSLQRADHGEQPFWMLVTLAAMLGQIGLPGGGFGVGYGPVNLMGSPHPRFAGPTLPQGANPVKDFIPVARIADMLLRPGETFTYNGATCTYPDIRLVYWAGGNPFHHHQDLNRLRGAWQRPETVIVHEQYWNALAKHADIVLPATTALERNDIAHANRERHMVAMRRIRRPFGESRNDYAIFSELAARLGAHAAFTEGRDEMRWLRKLYDECIPRAAQAGVELPTFDAFWEAGIAVLASRTNLSPIMLGDFRHDPERHPLKTPSGRIEIFSERIAGFGLADCPGHPVWQPPAEWLGAPLARRFPLHLITDQPSMRLHSQLDPSPLSVADKIAGRAPVSIHPDDAAARGLADGAIARVFNDRGATLCGVRITRAVRPGVVRISTGSWFDPDPAAGAPERHGNPNVLTRDVGASSLSQGCAAQTCLVEIAPYAGEPPPVTAHQPPPLSPLRTTPS